jgi:hypothetical protein
MKKKIILSLLLLLSIKSTSQEKMGTENNKFLISLHYVGNIRNDNFIGDNYNGVLGIDARYNLLKEKSFSVQAGLGLDFLNSRQSPYNLNVKNALLINPNVGIVLDGNKTFKPFFNLGYSFFTAKYTVSYSQLPSFDPLIQQSNSTLSFNYNSISINPGFRLYFDDKVYFQTDYKYLPIGSNINAHFITLGLGMNF